jgi:hypothetical protein
MPATPLLECEGLWLLGLQHGPTLDRTLLCSPCTTSPIPCRLLPRELDVELNPTHTLEAWDVRHLHASVWMT